MATGNLLNAWREATRVAELADELARLALEASDRADHDRETAETVAQLAEQAATASESAARSARAAALRLAAFAAEVHDRRLHDADETLDQARADEISARDRYHEGEREARGRKPGDGPA